MRPRTLKDFLSDNNSISCSSSDGFKSFPRIKPKDTNMHNLIEMELKSRKNNPPNSTFQTLMKTIRSILVKKSATMILPRSISRKLSSSSSNSSRSRRITRNNQAFCKGGSEIEVSTVKIKDIIRWKSFKDINVVEEDKNKSEPLDLPPQSPPLDFHRCMLGSTTTTTTTTTTTCSSKGSSWSECDFSTGYLSSWEPQNDDVQTTQKFSLSPFVIVGKDLVEPPTKKAGTKGVSSFKEDEQHSPVSVLQVGDDEFSTFDQSLSNIERRKQNSIQSVKRLEGLAKFDQYHLLDEIETSNYDDEVEEQDHVEERARHLLHCVKATSSLESSKDYYLDILLLDFFGEELIGRGEQITRNDDEYELELLRIAKDWINGSHACDIVHVNKDACIKDMDRRGGWSSFEKEKQELALMIEMAIMHSLVDEVLDLDG